MVYNYLLDLYQVLAERERSIKERQEDPAASPETKEYLQGRLAAVSDFHTFLKDNFHARLPRRLR